MFCLGHVRGSDEYTYVHSLNVALICGFIANKMFPNNEEMVQSLSIGGILHDLGKARIPTEILNKPGPLSDPEFETIKKHPIYGEELAQSFGVHDPRILSVIRKHHERYCGNGYPDFLSRNKINIEARIAAVADVFDALTARRAYKEPMGCRNAILMMIEKMSTNFDPDVLRTLIISIGLYPPGITVELSDGSLGIVVGTSEKDLVRPEVMISFDKYGKKVEDVKILDLSKNNESIFIKQVVNDHEKIITY
jgi:putative nucleotidyltransferase with HDIG domain